MSGDDIRPRGSVQVMCSRPTCRWEFWLPCDHALLPDGPFFCGTCSQGLTYEMCAQHLDLAENVLESPDSPGLRMVLESLRGQRIRVTVELVTAGEPRASTEKPS